MDPSVPCTMDSSFFSQQMPYCLGTLLKVSFFQKVILLLAGNLNFKFRIVFWKIWRFEKQIALSERKPPLRAYCPNIYTVPDNSSNFFLGTIWILFNVGIVVANSIKQQVVPPGFLNFPNSILDVIVHTCQIHHLKHKIMPSL